MKKKDTIFSQNLCITRPFGLFNKKLFSFVLFDGVFEQGVPPFPFLLILIVLYYYYYHYHQYYYYYFDKQH